VGAHPRDRVLALPAARDHDACNGCPGSSVAADTKDQHLRPDAGEGRDPLLPGVRKRHHVIMADVHHGVILSGFDI
jgi:hypothetical protein